MIETELKIIVDVCSTHMTGNDFEIEGTVEITEHDIRQLAFKEYEKTNPLIQGRQYFGRIDKVEFETSAT